MNYFVVMEYKFRGGSGVYTVEMARKNETKEDYDYCVDLVSKNITLKPSEIVITNMSYYKLNKQ